MAGGGAKTNLVNFPSPVGVREASTLAPKYERASVGAATMCWAGILANEQQEEVDISRPGDHRQVGPEQPVGGAGLSATRHQK